MCVRVSGERVYINLVYVVCECVILIVYRARVYVEFVFISGDCVFLWYKI